MSRVREKSRFIEQPLEKPNLWWGVAVALPVAIAAGALTIARMEQLKQFNSPVPTNPIISSVNAVGRLEPRGAVIKLSAPTSGLQASSRVQEVIVKEGQRVRKDEVIAILDNYASNKAALEESKAKLQEARANLTNVNVASPRDIQAQGAVIARLQAELAGEKDAQKATIARIEAQLRGEGVALQAMINRLKAELEGQKNASRATLARIQAEQRNARVELQRYEMLYKEGAISAQERDRRLLGLQTTNQQVIESQATRSQIIATLQQQIAEAKANQEKTLATLKEQLVEAKVNRERTIASLGRQIEQEKARLKRLQEVRPSNVQMAQAQVNNAIAVVKGAEAQLKLSYVTAPVAGEVLKVHTKAGETITPNGIAEIGRTDEMIVIAEVPEDSIGKVRLGQQATIISDNGAFSEELKGTVTEIGRKIGKKDVLFTDPAADVDARVVEVKISLPPQDSDRVAGLTYAKVLVKIDI
ncbi:MAG: HlyD family efflux transporter periplasmic adaptor subunit [Nostocaceae cyanobacterium]|nr:HlyD family efflux transporter periplasmic adaptor subunit [Nostocaceae cyanobacterium]